MRAEYRNFVEAAGLDAAQFHGAFAFGNDGEAIDDPVMADELARLVVTGRKTATASALAGYAPDEPLPAADGTFDLVLNGAGKPVAAVTTVAVSVVKFDEVTAAHAWAEGEGDRTLSWWRRAHEAFWRSYGLFSPEMLVVCETFRLLAVGGANDA